MAVKNFSELKALYDARSPREHLYMVSILVIALVGIFDLAVWTPSHAKHDQLDIAIQGLREDIIKFEEQMNQIYAQSQNDPNSSYRHRLKEINSQIDELNATIIDLNQVLISPKTMTQMLDKVFQKHKNLDVLSISSIPEDQLQVVHLPKAPDNALYRHGIEIIVEGGYRDVMNYLQELQNLNWQIYWESLKYEIEEYPNGKLTLIVYTLSLDKKWIGA